jgi:hypothetical protein
MGNSPALATLKNVKSRTRSKRTRHAGYSARGSFKKYPRNFLDLAAVLYYDTLMLEVAAPSKLACQP